jgi:hypothetical protein
MQLAAVKTSKGNHRSYKTMTLFCACTFRKGKEAMRRMLLSLIAITFLGMFVGCRHVGGSCDCYGYCCYPPCYGPCGGLGGGGFGGCSSCGKGMSFAGPDSPAPLANTIVPDNGVQPANKILPTPTPTPGKF